MGIFGGIGKVLGKLPGMGAVGGAVGKVPGVGAVGGTLGMPQPGGAKPLAGTAQGSAAPAGPAAPALGGLAGLAQKAQQAAGIPAGQQTQPGSMAPAIFKGGGMAPPGGMMGGPMGGMFKPSQGGLGGMLGNLPQQGEPGGPPSDWSYHKNPYGGGGFVPPGTDTASLDHPIGIAPGQAGGGFGAPKPFTEEGGIAGPRNLAAPQALSADAGLAAPDTGMAQPNTGLGQATTIAHPATLAKQRAMRSPRALRGGRR